MRLIKAPAAAFTKQSSPSLGLFAVRLNVDGIDPFRLEFFRLSQVGDVHLKAMFHILLVIKILILNDHAISKSEVYSIFALFDCFLILEYSLIIENGCTKFQYKILT